MAEHIVNELPNFTREIHLTKGKLRNSSMFPSNVIQTSNHLFFHLFLGNFLLEFRRIGNIWSVIISLIQIYFYQSPSSNTIFLLTFTMLLTLQKVFISLKKIRAFENSMNNISVPVWDSKLQRFIKTKCGHLKVGQILKLKTSALPADVLILTSSSNIYVDTKELNGRMRLETKTSVEEISALFEGRTPELAMASFSQLSGGKLLTEQPNDRIESFRGYIKLEDDPKTHMLDISNLLLRGSVIKITAWVLGVVVFTGFDAKIYRKLSRNTIKTSALDSTVDSFQLLILIFIFILTGISTILLIIRQAEFPHYLAETWIDIPFIFLLNYSAFFPLPIYCLLDICRLFHLKCLQNDKSLYNSKRSLPPSANSNELSDDLGQVEYIFIDKTGTLTQGEMELKKCFIQNKVYGDSKSCDDSPIQLESHPNFKFKDPSLYEDLYLNEVPKVKEFFECISLCHTTIFPKGMTHSAQFTSSSPDEKALLIAAHCMGYSVTTVQNTYSLLFNGVLQGFTVLIVNHLSSERKRMSILLKPLTTDRKPVLYCKGADSVILPRCRGNIEENEGLVECLNSFSYEGFRTLILAKKELSLEQCEKYEKRYQIALKALYNREIDLEQIADELERDLDFIGVSAIEDVLQSEVLNIVKSLKKAEVKLWMLTGDQAGAAINAAYSSEMFNPSMKLLKLIVSSENEVNLKLKTFLRRYTHAAVAGEPSVLSHFHTVLPEVDRGESGKPRYTVHMDNFNANERVKINNAKEINVGLVLNGDAIDFITKSSENAQMFLMVASLCQSIVGFSMNPLQKEAVVKLVRRHSAFRPVCLAIGDGANDAGMIYEANIGVYLTGKHDIGMAYLSDYSINKLKHLLPLLLLHGRLNYYRITKIILLSIYKSFLFSFANVFFIFYSEFSGSTLYFVSFYSEIVLAIPLLFIGKYETDGDEGCDNSQGTYKRNILKENIKLNALLKAIGLAFVHSVVVFFSVITISEVINEQGNTESIGVLGILIFLSNVYVYMMTLFAYTNIWNIYFVLAALISCSSMYMVIYVFDIVYTKPSNETGIINAILSSTLYIIVPVISTSLCFIVEFSITRFKTFTRRSSRISDYHVKDNEEMHTQPFRLIQYNSNLNKIFTGKGFVAGKECITEKEIYTISPFSLIFEDKYLESKFREESISKTVKYERNILLLYLTIISLNRFLLNLTCGNIIAEPVLFALGITFTAFAFIFIFTPYFQKYHDTFIVLVLSVVFTIEELQD